MDSNPRSFAGSGGAISPTGWSAAIGGCVYYGKAGFVLQSTPAEKKVNGPPRYFTTDWHAAYLSVRKLRDLHPQVVIPGHGAVMEGDELAHGLDHLVEYFEDFAKPDYGKFI